MNYWFGAALVATIAIWLWLHRPIRYRGTSQDIERFVESLILQCTSTSALVMRHRLSGDCISFKLYRSKNDAPNLFYVLPAQIASQEMAGQIEAYCAQHKLGSVVKRAKTERADILIKIRITGSDPSAAGRLARYTFKLLGMAAKDEYLFHYEGDVSLRVLKKHIAKQRAV